MGNNASSVIKKYSLPEQDWPISLDMIISNYMFSIDAISLRRWATIEYCNKWVKTIRNLLISDTSIPDIELAYIRIMGKKNTHNINLSIEKMSDAIAAFYVKIVHIYAIIFFSLNPEFEYTYNGISKKLSRGEIVPKNASVQIIKYNSCVSGLVKNPDKAVHGVIGGGGENSDISVVPEFEQLYHDKYNLDMGAFSEMSSQAQKEYFDNLRMFYNTVTSSPQADSPLPKHVQSFGDIRREDILSAPQMVVGGNRESDRLNKSFDTLSGQLMMEYAIVLKKLIRDTNDMQTSVLKIFQRLFIFCDSECEIGTINPECTVQELGDIVKDARTLIIKLHLNCEVNYTKSVQLYESIVEQKILDTTSSQITTLKNLRDQLYGYEDNDDDKK